MALGSRLRQLRNAKGFTQKEVAKAIGVSERTYIAYELEDCHEQKRNMRNWQSFTKFLLITFSDKKRSMKTDKLQGFFLEREPSSTKRSIG